MNRSDNDLATKHRWIASAAAAWSLIFAVFHIVWAGGWYIGLDPVETAKAFSNPAKLAFDQVVAVMCLAAVPVSLALGTPWMRIPQRVLAPLAWTGTLLLVLRAIASLFQVFYEFAMGRFTFQRLGVWEPWFYIGATLFGLNLWLYQRK